jgi:hypothetical protein|eukprot:COSAG06_NODE_2600_length_6600_cov_1.974004_5_plen_135_part_00
MPHFVALLKLEHLPRQARDKHTENLKKRDVFCLGGMRALVRKPPFWINSIESIQKRSFLPRQARDKHTQSLVVSCRVESLGFPTGEGWRPWAVGGKVAGGVVSYSVPPTAHAAAGSEVEAGAGIEYLLKPTPAN